MDERDNIISHYKEVIDRYYERSDEDRWYRCIACGRKIPAREDDYSELALHERREHPER